MFADQIRSWRLWRGQDDPNVIVIEETFDSRGAAEGLWTHPATKAAMEADGIDMESVPIEYLDEVGSSHALALSFVENIPALSPTPAD